MIYVVIAVLSAVAVLFAVIILADVIPLAKRWYERIHIGQWESDEAFAAKVNTVNSAWLKKTPSVRLSDNTRFTLIDRIKGNYTNSRLQSWQKAALLIGADDKAAQEYLKSGTWKNDFDSVSDSPDIALLAWAVLKRSSDKNTVKSYMDKILNWIFDSAEKNSTVPYNKAIPNMRFVDTVGMVCPFLFEYAKTYSDEKAFLLAEKQLEEYLENGIHSKFFIPVHSFNKITVHRQEFTVGAEAVAGLLSALREDYLLKCQMICAQRLKNMRIIFCLFRALTAHGADSFFQRRQGNPLQR